MNDGAVDYVCRTEVNSSSTRIASLIVPWIGPNLIAQRIIGVTPQALSAREMPQENPVFLGGRLILRKRYGIAFGFLGGTISTAPVKSQQNCRVMNLVDKAIEQQ